MKSDGFISRRQVLAATVSAGAGLMAGSLGCSQMKRRTTGEPRIAFVTLVPAIRRSVIC